MGKNTNISWSTHTFSPWHGCCEVSPACGLPMPGEEGKPHGRCYAKTFSIRCGYSDAGSKFPIWGASEPRRFFEPKHWDCLRAWDREAECAKRRDRVFCGSMCDFLEERQDLPAMAAARSRTYEYAVGTRSLDWLWLTKRAQNYQRLKLWPFQTMALPNFWLMTTVEAQQWAWRIAAVLAVPSVVVGISAEPLLGPLDLPQKFLDRASSAWLIVGGESGAGARPLNGAHVRRLRDQCREAGVAFWMKQWGGVSNHRAGLEDLPEDLRIRQLPTPRRCRLAPLYVLPDPDAPGAPVSPTVA